MPSIFNSFWSKRTLLATIRRARRLRSFITLVFSFALLAPAALGFGLGHGQAATPDVASDFVVICTGNGFEKIEIRGLGSPASQCSCAFSCAVGCCAPNSVFSGQALGPAFNRDRHKQIFALLVAPHWRKGFDGEPKAIRAPPST